MTTLFKVQGSNNKFFLLDQTQLSQPLATAELQTLAQNICHPQTGLLHGADGLLVIQDPSCPGPIGQMRIFNADGSQASMCGNGLRTVARYLGAKHHLKQFQVETLTANLQVSQQPDWAPEVPAFSVEISPVSFNLQDLPCTNLGEQPIVNQPLPELDPHLKFTALAVPNPHLISFVTSTDVQGSGLEKLGHRLNQSNPYFPDGVNVSWAQILGPHKLFVRTFERGVGLTNACGTGMSATCLAFLLSQSATAAWDELITVYNPGGQVQVRVHQSSPQHYWMELIGNASIMDRIELPESDLHRANDWTHAIIHESSETAAYEKFVQEHQPKIN